MNLEQEFVPYQEALELKKLGFDEPCFGYYNSSGKFMEDFGKQNSSCSKPGMHGKYCTAPTYSQAFRWFREKYNFHSWLKPFVDFDDNDKLLYEYEILIIKEGRYNNDMETGIFTNPEEAELACLRKLIEIVKNTKT